jgi:hypothetical protein
MNSNIPLSSEQKLDAIYDMLKKQESRQKRTTIFRNLKWLFILGILYIVTVNPAFLQGVFTAFVGTTMDAVKPMILEQAKNMLQTQTDSYQTGALEKMQELLLQK